MDLATIELLILELRKYLIGRRFGKVFVLSRSSMAIDFRLDDSRYLFVSVEPVGPRMYLIRRRVRDLEKASSSPSAFAMQLKKRLSGSEVVSIGQLPGERIVRIDLAGRNELGEEFRAGIVAQLTGKSANLFLINSAGRIVESLRDTQGEGQQIADIYRPPGKHSINAPSSGGSRWHIGEFDSLSEALDAADLEKRSEAEFRSVANAVRKGVAREIGKLERLRSKLLDDLATHGDAEHWKKLGDLLLANASTAKREDSKVFVIDYFDESTPTVGIEVDEKETLTSAAERYFKRYIKARNARDEIARRIDVIRRDLKKARAEQLVIETAIEDRDIDLLRERLGPNRTPTERRKKDKGATTSTVARIFTSADGFEILVGKRAKDNDQLTFKIARSLDTWMHAADYPGSHVVIRNPDRKELPPSTLLEAAQLAAFYSQGKAQPKAAVHYTLKKFVNKPKGSVPGLVSLASFKTLIVEPMVPKGVTRRQP